MFKELFDSYNLRARLSIYVILITPIIASVYALYKPIRNIGASAILVIVLASFSNYFLILLRLIVKHHYYSETAALFLRPNDAHIDSQTKARYYSTLSTFNHPFNSITSDTPENEIEAICADTIMWLKNKTRDNRLVQEESILYGFINNLCNMKLSGLIITVFSMILQLIIAAPRITSFTALLDNHQYLFLFVMDLFFVVFWTAGVSLCVCKSAAEKYAYALLGAIDNMTPNPSN